MPSAGIHTAGTGGRQKEENGGGTTAGEERARVTGVAAERARAPLGEGTAANVTPGREGHFVTRALEVSMVFG